MSMSGQWISIAAGDRDGSRAYLAIPEAGRGPGLVLLDEAPDPEIADLYAAEGYAVLCPERLDVDIKAAAQALRARSECTGKLGVLGFGRGGTLAYRAAAAGGIDGAVVYCGAGIEDALDLAPRIACPLVMHFAEKDPDVPPEAVALIKSDLARRSETAVHVYPGTARGFDRKSAANYNRAASGLAHSRSIALFRRVMGPHYDLEALWEAHIRYEFETRDVAATMATMVADPYVNHIPVMTGGVGARELARFYANHFIPKCPKDIKMVPISRTVGAGRIVDEMVVSFTHDVEIDWMLPGVPPTGRRVEVPIVAIVGFRGDKLYHEHIYWDQASVLVQIGLLDSKGLPVAGIETAKKLLDETLPSNTLMKRWADSAPRAGVGTPPADRR
jgi:carboxymethylenebutenolidase